jgi:pepF/M3 family oligoendopeptidase
MTVVYPGLDAPEFEQSFRSTIDDIAALAQLFDDKQIGARQQASLDDALVDDVETVIQRFNDAQAQVRQLHAYIHSFVATNSRDTLAQAKMSELQQHIVRLNQLETRFNAWIGSLDIDALIGRSSLAEEHAFALQQAQRYASHQMSPAEEDLAADLNTSAGTAWARLHSNITSQIVTPFEQDGAINEITMSMLRTMAFDPDREVRRRAYETELAAWEKVAVPLAAALNSIKGEVNTLSRRRGWASPLDASLLGNSIDRQTLDAMLEAARESFPDFRRYLRAKAHAIGAPALAWYDLFAPVGTSGKAWEYDAATDFIVEQFGSYSSRLSEFAARAFREQWIDAEPRPGKRDGAFCMWLRRDESRVFSNFRPSFNGVSTLAHELGHAYHNLNLYGRTMLQRAMPMTLAETASIFCETIIRQAALAQADRQEEIAILEASLQGSCQVVVDISSRFLFEQSVFERRQQRELSVDEFKQLMIEAQQATYGDGLDQSVLHPFMWAVKGHYYSTRSFYNYPYMFGLLFGLGLYARYQHDPEAFKAGYDDLLSSTGMADATTLAQRFGIELRTIEFWRSSLDVIRGNIDRFEQLIAPGLAWGSPSEQEV